MPSSHSRRSENKGPPLVLHLLLIRNFQRGLSIMEPGARLQGEGNQKPSALATLSKRGSLSSTQGSNVEDQYPGPIPLLCLPCFFFCSVAMQNRLLSLALSASCLRVSASFHLAAPNLSTNTIQMQLPARHPSRGLFRRATRGTAWPFPMPFLGVGCFFHIRIFSQVKLLSKVKG